MTSTRVKAEAAPAAVGPSGDASAVQGKHVTHGKTYSLTNTRASTSSHARALYVCGVGRDGSFQILLPPTYLVDQKQAQAIIVSTRLFWLE